MLDLRPPDARPAAEAFADQYRSLRLAEGWQPLTSEVARALPDAVPPGFTRLYWSVRRESLAALTAFLEGMGEHSRPLTVADAGAGFPWLSYRLAELGHRVVAFDLSGDPDFGVGAARLYGNAATWRPADLRPGRFLALLGDLAHPPLTPGAWDAVICNASLHYVADLEEAAGELARSLAPGGALIILDSPIARQGRPGHRPGGRILGRDEVHRALEASGLRVEWRSPRRGWLWHRHQIKNRLLRRPLFDFPVVIGYRFDEGFLERSAG